MLALRDACRHGGWPASYSLNVASDHVLALLGGPRGRRMCVEALEEVSSASIWTLSCAARRPAEVSAELTDTITRSDLGLLAARRDALSLLPALAATVDAAAYWQSDEFDSLLAQPDVIEALVAVAEAIDRAPASRWWDSPISLGDQHRVLLDMDQPPPSLPIDSAAALRAWRADTLDDERRAADRPSDPSANYSGYWWSTPALAGLAASTRSLPVFGPVGLALAEDRMDWSAATVETLHVESGARVYEIDGAEAWSELVERYPLEVTNSRRHDWWRVTGRTGRWLVPDYQAVAADFDAVHLTVFGYLSTAGRALPVDGSAATVLTGWDPDQAWWLTDSLTVVSASRWVTDSRSEPLSWHPEP